MTFDRPAPADPRRRHLLKGAAVALPFAPAHAARRACELGRHSGWAAVNEPLITRRIAAACMLAPLVTNLADSGIRLRIGALGPRSRAAIMARGGSPYRQLVQLQRKRGAIPGPLAVDCRFLHHTLAECKGMLRVPMPFGRPAAGIVHDVRALLGEGGP
jgi:ABC-type nitrate/sulfonate/bicarbonate transport system substrate-binding protein